MSDSTPINCEEALRLLAEFLDHELQADERQGVERHLEACRSCFSRAEFERRLKGEIRRLDREEISPAFEERVRRLLDSFAISSAARPGDGSPA
jgi:anti-sigma factor (TIGR02949 family)